jgi:uncharacterized protein (TIGR01777 family)
MRIAISGASGTIGRRLLRQLAADGATLYALGRRAAPNLPAGARSFAWDPPREEPPATALDVDAVIHLAGENVAQRWTAEARRRILESRVEGTRNLVRAMARLARKPAVLICASATGYYGSRGDETLDESSAPGSGFLADVCRAWESEALAAEALGMRVVRMRTGVVLDPGGGALPRMLPPFRMGAGGRLGSGRQWMPWIHRDDLTALFRFALDGSLAGAVNAVAPDPATNASFTRALARALGRPALIPVPAFALRALFGEMAGMLLDSQRVVPRQAEAAGFRFRFPQLESALSELLG